MYELGIDIETYSSYDLSSCGVYRYVESPDFTILLFSYSVDGGPVECVDLASGEELPAEVFSALTSPDVKKTAFNAVFERVCISAHFFGKRLLDPRQWSCTMVLAARMGLPLSLGQCCEVLGLSEGKLSVGKTLIRYFSMPGKNGRHLPGDAPEKWSLFKAYNVRDVEVEQAIRKKVCRLHPAPFDEELYVADQEINDRGVLIDRVLVDAAARLDEEYKQEVLDKARELTGLENPNSPAQLKKWLHKVTGVPVDSLSKKSFDDLGKQMSYFPRALKMLELRRELGKTSNKKYAAMQQCVCEDGRIRGLLQFYGAARTGRWAGRLVQVQNLPQNHLKDLPYARSLVRLGDLEELELSYVNVSQVLSELIRTSFVASPGKMLHVCDFSAIECRVIAWLAGEEWVLDVFRRGGDIYCANASKMFGVPVEKYGVNSELRPKGKIATLALGYSGGVSALEAMGGGRMGLSMDEEKEIVTRWRRSNPRIVKLWQTVEDAAIAVISTGKSVTVNRGIELSRRWGMLLATLPSGRTICYPRAEIGVEYDDGYRGDHDVIEYEGMNQTTKKWEKVRTYGGKLVENLVQAIARDILGVVLLRARAAGLDVVFHIHDEIVVEAPQERTLQEVVELFGQKIEWCKGLPLSGAGYSTMYYLKD